jgi:hypothetical protein
MFTSIKEFVLTARLKLNSLQKTKKVYQGPLIDAMAQCNDQVSGELIATAMHSAGVEKMALFGRQQNPNDSTQHVIELADSLGELIILGSVKRFDQHEDLTPQFVTETVESILEGPCRFVGELQMTHGDKYSSNKRGSKNPNNEVTLRGERYINPTSPNMFSLMNHLDGKDVPVFLHWEMYDWDRDYPLFSKLFLKYPNINFVIPHAGYAKPVYINEILNRYKNIYITLSKREMFHFRYKWLSYKGQDLGRYSYASIKKQNKLGSSMLYTNGEIQNEWLHLLRRFPDKFLFATDCHKLPAFLKYKEIVDLWREILGQLDRELAEKIAYSNAKKLFKI